MNNLPIDNAEETSTAEPVAPETEAPALALDMTPVVSSNVESIGHNGEALFIKFKNGGTYRYPTAGRIVHDEMLRADSPGRFFRSEVSAKHVGEKMP